MAAGRRDQLEALMGFDLEHQDVINKTIAKLPCSVLRRDPLLTTIGALDKMAWWCLGGTDKS
jgi:hypothetical protein